ncbi:UDP-N-acetylglucosamine--dolichyl-phosphate N-acetylglucosaminephosphotransferase, partial [Perkinsus olseni]
ALRWDYLVRVRPYMIGINGLEVGQSMVLALSLILNDLLQLYRHAQQAGTWPPYESHLMSLYLLLPFVGGTPATQPIPPSPALLSILPADGRQYVPGCSLRRRHLLLPCWHDTGCQRHPWAVL